jgi:hypothetical protein
MTTCKPTMHFSSTMQTLIWMADLHTAGWAQLFFHAVESKSQKHCASSSTCRGASTSSSRCSIYVSNTTTKEKKLDILCSWHVELFADIFFTDTTKAAAEDRRRARQEAAADVRGATQSEQERAGATGDAAAGPGRWRQQGAGERGRAAAVRGHQRRLQRCRFPVQDKLGSIW